MGLFYRRPRGDRRNRAVKSLRILVFHAHLPHVAGTLASLTLKLRASAEGKLELRVKTSSTLPLSRVLSFSISSL